MSRLKVGAIVLAAGQSSRMGTSKMALPWGNSTVLETTISNIMQAGIVDILVVTGGYKNEVESLPLLAQNSRVHNPNYAAGEMISSVKLALKIVNELEWHSDGILVIPGDMPLIDPTLVKRCLNEWMETSNLIVAPRFQGQRGHPVIFPFDIFQQFETLPAHKSPRDLLKAKSNRFRMYEEADGAVIIDIDTPAEYEQYRPK